MAELNLSIVYKKADNIMCAGVDLPICDGHMTLFIPKVKYKAIDAVNEFFAAIGDDLAELRNKDLELAAALLAEGGDALAGEIKTSIKADMLKTLTDLVAKHNANFRSLLAKLIEQDESFIFELALEDVFTIVQCILAINKNFFMEKLAGLLKTATSGLTNPAKSM